MYQSIPSLTTPHSGKPPGNFLKGRIPHPGHKGSAKPRPLGQKTRAKNPPRGQLFKKKKNRNCENSTGMLTCLEILPVHCETQQSARGRRHLPMETRYNVPPPPPPVTGKIKKILPWL